MKVLVSEIFGVRCIVASEGQKLHDMILDSLKAGEEVLLDFSGVKQFASPFFNYSIGQLLNEISQDSFRKLLHLEGLDETGEIVVGKVIENASVYHADADYKKIVDDILERQAKGGE